MEEATTRSLHVRKSKTVLEPSGEGARHAVDSGGFQVLHSGFQSLMDSRFFLNRIPHSIAQDSRFHKQIFLSSRELVWIPLHGDKNNDVLKVDVILFTVVQDLKKVYSDHCDRKKVIKLIEKMLHCTVGTMCFCIFVYSRLYNFPKEDNCSTSFYIKFKTHMEAKHSNQGRIEPRHFRFVFMVTPLPGSTKRKKN